MINILWRLEGVLFDTNPAMTYAFSKMLNELGLTVAINYVDELIRQSLAHCIDVISQRCRIAPQELLAGYQRHYQNISPENQKLMPGAVEVCRAVSESGGKNFLLSHHSCKICQALLDGQDVSRFFTEIIAFPNDSTHQSPSSQVLEMMYRHRTIPEHTILIGTGERDMLLGQALTVRTCLFGNRPKPSIQIDYQIESLSQLLSLLGSEHWRNT